MCVSELKEQVAADMLKYCVEQKKWQCTEKDYFGGIFGVFFEMSSAQKVAISLNTPVTGNVCLS